MRMFPIRSAARTMAELRSLTARARVLPLTLVLVLVLVLAIAIAGCGSSVSTSSFSGEEREVAQTVANLQSDTSAQDEARVCSNDLSRAVVERLGGTRGCEKAIKTQQAEIDPGLEVKVESVHITGPSSARLAAASVRSTFEGKKRTSTLLFTKEGGKWKVTGLQ